MEKKTAEQLPLTILIICTLLVFGIGFWIPMEIYWDFLYFPIILFTILYFKKDTIIAVFIICFVLFLVRQLQYHQTVDINWPPLVINLVLIAISCFSVIYVIALLQTTWKENAEEKNRLYSIIDNTTIGIIICNAEGTILLMNPWVSQQFGYNVDELIGQNVDVLVPDSLKNTHKDHRASYQHGPRNRPMGIGYNLFGKKKNGELVPVEISLSHYFVKKQIQVIAFINDISVRLESEKKIIDQNTALSQITEALKSANAQLEKRVAERTETLNDTVVKLLESKTLLEKEIEERISMQEKLTANEVELKEALIKEKELGELKSRFVSMASHEFRTPLSAILSSSSLISKYELTDQQPQRLKHIDRIKTSIQHLIGILNDFLSLSKIEEGKIDVVYHETYLPDFLEEIMTESRNMVKPGQYFENNFENIQKTVFLDIKLTHAILSNLISNAVKYSEEGKPIMISGEIQNQILTITIKDKGIGIPLVDQKHLFERFFRANNAIYTQGTGLGLSIVKNYVELLGGNLSFKSVEGKGSEFIVEIPLK